MVKISLMGTYRVSGVNTVSGAIFSDRVINITGFRPSGMSDGNIMGCALYVWNATTNQWEPMLQPATT